MDFEVVIDVKVFQGVARFEALEVPVFMAPSELIAIF